MIALGIVALHHSTVRPDTVLTVEHAATGGFFFRVRTARTITHETRIAGQVQARECFERMVESHTAGLPLQY